MHATFLLGNLHCSDKAKKALNRTPLDLIARHAVNDHGIISKQEAQQNVVAMEYCGEIISRYLIDPTKPKRGHVLVITTASWGDTHVQLESEKP